MTENSERQIIDVGVGGPTGQAWHLVMDEQISYCSDLYKEPQRN